MIAGGPILQRFKPAVGNWVEINANECCNSIPTTTTTTTQGGGVTPTAFVKGYWLNTDDACTTTIYGSLVFYSASSTLEAGISVFSDAALTIPVTAGYVIYSGGMFAPLYLVGAGGVLSLYNCPESTTTTTTNSVFSESTVTNVDPQ